MNTLHMKVTPRPNSDMDEIAFYSCPQTHDTAQKTLNFIQKTADQRNIACDYTLIDDLTFFAVRAARMWLLTEPGDFDADHLFRVQLVRAGFTSSAGQITGINMTGENDHTIKVTTEGEVLTIDTKAGTTSIEPIARADHVLRGPVG